MGEPPLEIKPDMEVTNFKKYIYKRKIYHILFNNILSN